MEPHQEQDGSGKVGALTSAVLPALDFHVFPLRLGPWDVTERVAEHGYSGEKMVYFKSVIAGIVAVVIATILSPFVVGLYIYIVYKPTGNIWDAPDNGGWQRSLNVLHMLGDGGGLYGHVRN